MLLWTPRTEEKERKAIRLAKNIAYKAVRIGKDIALEP